MSSFTRQIQPSHWPMLQGVLRAAAIAVVSWRKLRATVWWPPQRRGGLDGAVLGPEAFVLRFCGVQADDRLLVVNLGRDLPLHPAPEPLLVPPEGEDGWQIPGHAAVVQRPMARAHP